MEFIFHPIHTDHLHLNEVEWNTLLRHFIMDLKGFRLGNQLMKELKHHFDRGCHIIITNKDQTQTIYPKTQYIDSQHVTVVFPSTPYFVDVGGVNSRHQPLVMFLIHELIHCVRIFRGLDRLNLNEKETISGSMMIKDHIISENQFAKHFGLAQRSSHKCTDVYVYDNPKTHQNRCHFTKDSFLTYGWTPTHH
jgi:hypothetical protein